MRAREQAAKQAGKSTLAIFIVLLVLALLGSGGAIGMAVVKRAGANAAKAALQNQINSIADAEAVYNEYINSQAELQDMLILYDSTKISNEYMMEFWNRLEECMPSNINVKNINSSSTTVSLSMVSDDYDSIARLVVELRNIDCIEDAFIASITEVKEESGGVNYQYTVTCNYVLPVFEATEATNAEAAVDATEAENAAE